MPLGGIYISAFVRHDVAVHGTSPRSICHVAEYIISATAASYSTAAGVMAGFAFACLGFVITARSLGDADRSKNGWFDLAAQALGAAFVVLLMSSFDYAILAGEPAPGGRAASVEVLAGAGFTVAVLQLFYALVLMVRAYHQDKEPPLTDFFVNVGAFLLCPLAYLMVVSGSAAYVEALHRSSGELVEVVGEVVGVCLVVALIALRFVPRVFAVSAAQPLKIVRNPPQLALGVGTLSIAGISITAVAIRECAALPPALILAALVGTALALWNQARWFVQLPSEYRAMKSVKELLGKT
jgi:hypothetical protein